MDVLNQMLILKLYVAGFAISFLAQSISQNKFGKESAWGINQGWQNEIAIWNVFAIIVLTTIIVKNFESDVIILALFVLSLGFGINHFVAAKSKRNKRSNVAGAVTNGAGLLVITLWFLFFHR